MSSNWDDIHRMIDQIMANRDEHVDLQVSVQPLDNGHFYVSLGTFGSAKVRGLDQAHLFLGGVLMGMNINRG